MKNIRLWNYWSVIFIFLNLVVGSMILSLFTSGALFAIPDFHLLGLFLFLAFIFLAFVFLTARPPAIILKSTWLAFMISFLVPFAAMLGASIYIASEVQSAFVESVLHSVVMMGPILLISGAPVIFPMLVINFVLLDACRRVSKSLSH